MGMRKATISTVDGAPTVAPSPRGVPVLGNFPELQRKGQLQFSVDNWQRLGDVVRLRLGPFVAYTLAHPDHIRQVLIENKQNYGRGRGYAALRLLNGLGLLTSEGPLWSRQRRLIQPAFTPRVVPQYAAGVTAATEALLRRWDATPDQVLDANVEMLSLALNMIGRTMLSIDLDTEARELALAFTEAVAIIGARITAPLDIPLRVPTSANRRFLHVRGMLDARIYALIAERRRTAQAPDDLLGKLLAARDAETGAEMSAEQVRDEVMTIFFAGHETIAQTLTWTWYLLAQHPAVEAQLHAEVDAELAGRVPTIADLPRLTYTRMVVDETLRLYPPVWAIPRGAVGADVIGGYSIAAGAMVFPAPYLAHRHPAFWEHPDVFDPTRFTPERVAARPSCAYLPFGAGPRACIGQNYALQEALLVIATIAGRYRLRLVAGHPVVAHSAITLSPRHGVRMTLQRRETAG